MLNGLDLFSGIGGITLALSEWVRPIAYCEIDAYAQGVLLSRMSEGQISRAPIWDDITSLGVRDLPPVDIIYGGFPCQDISVAGKGKGLAGERSGLFFEIMRLVSEIRPTFLFLENVPAITTRGLGTVTAEITKRGYDCRWTTLSAAEVGANHRRERWWLLAYSNSRNGGALFGSDLQSEELENEGSGSCSLRKDISNPNRNTIRKQPISELGSEGEAEFIDDCKEISYCDDSRQPQSETVEPEERKWFSDRGWWTTEPNVGRVANGIPFRVDRIKCLGNAVVPLQAKEAFKELMGIK